MLFYLASASLQSAFVARANGRLSSFAQEPNLSHGGLCGKVRTHVVREI